MKNSMVNQIRPLKVKKTFVSTKVQTVIQLLDKF